MGDPKGLGRRDGEDLNTGINEAQWEDGINEPSYPTGLFHDPAWSPYGHTPASLMMRSHRRSWNRAARRTAKSGVEKHANRLRRSAEDFVMGGCGAGVDRSIRSACDAARP